jgi:hypothetical protein
LDQIIKLCASPTTTVQAAALTFLLENLQTRYADYDPLNFLDVPFVPAQDANGAPCMGSPRQVDHTIYIPYLSNNSTGFLRCEVGNYGVSRASGRRPTPWFSSQAKAEGTPICNCCSRFTAKVTTKGRGGGPKVV